MFSYLLFIIIFNSFFCWKIPQRIVLNETRSYIYELANYAVCKGISTPSAIDKLSVPNTSVRISILFY